MVKYQLISSNRMDKDNSNDYYCYINNISDFKKFLNTYNNFVIYIYSIVINSCKELFKNNQIISYFSKRKIKIMLIDANASLKLISFLGISFFPIFLFYKNKFKVCDINGNLNNILNYLDKGISENFFLNIYQNEDLIM